MKSTAAANRYHSTPNFLVRTIRETHGSAKRALRLHLGLCLTSDMDVIALKEAGVSDDLLMAKIRNSRGEYRLDTEDLIALKRAKVSEGVIQAMLEAQGKAR